MNNPAKQAGKTSGDLARTIAKQIAEEPFEILKETGEQISGQTEAVKPQEDIPGPQDQEVRKDEAKSQRIYGALQKEIEDIRKQGLLEDLQKKISGGENIPLEDYPGLSIDEKQVLKAQMEAFKIRKQEAQYSEGVGDVPAIHSKPSRRFGAGQKHEAEKQQTRVEKPIPPSG